MNINDLIGETTEYEKKVALETKKPKSWCKTISAFANGKGGKLIFGVDDNDNIIGLADMKKDSEDISEIIKTHLNPIPKFDMNFKNIDGKDIVVLEVFAGDQTPYYYDGNGQLIAYLRVGNESVPASPIELQELVLRGTNTSYDSLKAHYNFDEMSFSKLKSVYKQNTGNSFEDTDFESFGIVNSKGELTNAGVLIADECPLRHSRVFCTRWNGLTKASGVVDAIDDNEYTGSLIILLQESYNFVLRNSKKAWMKENDKRVELPDYPERAVMEGIVNALIHRSYTELGSEVHIDMYDDRLEIYSPGGMVGGVSIKDVDILNVPSKRRNPILADIFGRLKYMERRGSGFKKIINAYETQQNYKKELAPVFKAFNNDFILTLFNLNYGVDDLKESEPQRNPKETPKKPQRNPKEIEIINVIKNAPNITVSGIAKQLNYKIDSVQHYINKLKDEGLIVHKGSTKAGYWEVKQD